MWDTPQEFLEDARIARTGVVQPLFCAVAVDTFVPAVISWLNTFNMASFCLSIKPLFGVGGTTALDNRHRIGGC